MNDNDLTRRVKELEQRVADLETIEYSKIFFKVFSHTSGTAWSTPAARSSSDDGLIDLSATFGIPAQVTAIIVRVDIRDSDAGTPIALCSMGPSDPPTEARFYSDPAYTGEWQIYSGAIVSCDANGDIYISFSESTTSFAFYIIGYVI